MGRVTIVGKKIVVITGSPQKGGNGFAMTDAFVKAAGVIRFDVAMKKYGVARTLQADHPHHSRRRARRRTVWAARLVQNETISCILNRSSP